jgi:hypothetical protein
MVLSASIVLTLGVVHVVYTFWGPKLWNVTGQLQTTTAERTLVSTDRRLLPAIRVQMFFLIRSVGGNVPAKTTRPSKSL